MRLIGAGKRDSDVLFVTASLAQCESLEQESILSLATSWRLSIVPYYQVAMVTDRKLLK